MPHDKPEPTVAPTTRRTFLARAAAGGALATVGTAAGSVGLLAAPVAAQDAPATGLAQPPALEGDAFAAFAVPLELAAVLTYQTAIATLLLSSEWQTRAREFQGHHQAVVDALSGLLAEGTGTPTPNRSVLTGALTAVRSSDNQDGVLRALAGLERTLAATHLYALGGLTDTSLAKTVAQVLATESQQAATLGLAGGADLETLTPSSVTTEGARTDLTEDAVTPTTTTTAPSTTTSTGGGN